MATVTSALQAVQGYGNPGRKAYYVENIIDWSDHTVNPSAGDVVQALTIPAGTMIMVAGMEMVEAPTVGGGTDAVATLGTDTDADEWVTGFDFDAASAGDYAPVAAAASPEVHGTANTLDVTFSAVSASSISAGKTRVFAWLLDVGTIGTDKAADEVVRDQLA